MDLVALPAFADNYIWMLHDGRQALVVDPGDATPVLQALSSRALTLTGILVTHHHADHVGGLPGLLPVLQGPVWGPAREAVPVPVTPCTGGQQVAWNGRVFDVLDVPGHTAGHVAYFLSAQAGEEPALFCGDTLFSGGCGRLFEGSPTQMADSLHRLAALPSDTRVCCAHEYTLSNLRFALAVEPRNAVLRDYTVHCEALRAQGQPTLPSRLAVERDINPFLRCEQPEVIAAARRHDPAANDEITVFAALRGWKDVYR